jgi:glutamine amidotransferase
LASIFLASYNARSLAARRNSAVSESIVIVDYDAGNLRSVQRACAFVGMEAVISAKAEDVAGADRVIFPGVGSAESAVDTLRERGLDEALKAFYNAGKPLLGICLGTQIVLEHTAEGDKDCLGLVEGVSERFSFADRTLKVPHIGWNEVVIEKTHPVLKNVRSGDEFYFVHAYYVIPSSRDVVYGKTEYGIEYCSVLGQNNLFATQFHLEKSGRMGLSILDAFREWDGQSC